MIYPSDFQPPTDASIIELEATKSWEKNGIIFILPVSNQQFTLNEAVTLNEKLGEFTNNKRIPMISDVREGSALTAETRAYYGSKDGTRFAASFAFLVKSNYSKVLANVFIKLQKLHVPTRMFTDIEEAITWSNQFK